MILVILQRLKKEASIVTIILIYDGRARPLFNYLSLGRISSFVPKT